MSSEFLDKLLSGSRELDRLRSNTNQAIRILLGLIQKDDQWKDRLRSAKNRFVLDDRDRYLTWEIRCRNGKPQARLLEVGPSTRTYIRFSTEPAWTDGHTYAENVVTSWKSLPGLSEKLRSSFPGLDAAAAPLLAAAV